MSSSCLFHDAFLFFFTDPATPEIYTLSLHDALPIFRRPARGGLGRLHGARRQTRGTDRSQWCRQDDVHRRDHGVRADEDRKSTRLNSSHMSISYAVFCLKKKKKMKTGS